MLFYSFRKKMGIGELGKPGSSLNHLLMSRRQVYQMLCEQQFFLQQIQRLPYILHHLPTCYKFPGAGLRCDFCSTYMHKVHNPCSLTLPPNHEAIFRVKGRKGKKKYLQNIHMFCIFSYISERQIKPMRLPCNKMYS